MRYKKLNAVILKKQNYKEADQIVTVYSKELGKVRCLARSIRSSKSKMVGSFQDLSNVEMEISTSRSLPTLVSSKTLKSFNKTKSDLIKTAVAFYGLELMIKLTADEQANEQAYELLLKFLSKIETEEPREEILYTHLNNFSLELLTVLGFSMEFAGTKQLSTKPTERHNSINEFVEYILERNIKSKKFLNSIQNGYKS